MNVRSPLGAAAALGAAALLAASPAAAAGDPVRGQTLYEAKCGGCHSVDRNRIGPKHRGVVGRKAGAVPDYPYSAALKNSGLVWTPKTLDVWLKGPPKLVPGTRMGFSLADDGERADIIAYLASVSK